MPVSFVWKCNFLDCFCKYDDLNVVTVFVAKTAISLLPYPIVGYPQRFKVRNTDGLFIAFVWQAGFLNRNIQIQ
jgi:hypothetical protein